MKLEKIQRGFERNLLLLPGWGFDVSIFFNQKWEYNLWFFENFSLNSELAINKLRQEHESFSVLAWSIGGFILDKWFKTDSLLKNKIEKVFLMSVPAYFNADIVEKIKIGLKSNLVNTLKHFYSLVFYGNIDFYKKFVDQYQTKYLSLFSYEDLIYGLNFLQKYKQDFNQFQELSTLYFYSEKDYIVSYSSVQSFLPSNVHIVPNTHIPFWYNEVVNAVNQK